MIAAPSSTKNKSKERDPEMHQTKKGNQWYFGMKVHIGVDSESGLIHSVETTAANVHALTPAADLLHGEETVVYADAGYQGIEKRDEMKGRGSASASPCAPESGECCQRRRRDDWMIWSKQPKLTSDPRRSSHFG